MFSIMLFGSCNKPGCTDPDAVNYDSSANDEDGTCQYVPSLSTTPLIYDTIAFSVQTGGIISSEGNSQITIKGICWSNSPNPTVNNDTTVNGFGLGSFVSNISNLNYNTTYFFRAYATNSNGTGYGNELSLNIGSFTNIPDANFEQALIDLGYDNVIDGKVITSKIDHIDSLNIPDKSIIDLSGIQDFISLTYLNCNFNQLTSLDVSQNTALTYLICNNNQLTSFVSQNAALTYLNCNFNQLTSLDVSQNTALTYLRCEGNQLTSLDVSQNTALNILFCSINQLTSLDVSQNLNLFRLVCPENNLNNIDVSFNTDLITLSCYGNPYTDLNVSNNPNLDSLYCGQDSLTSLDVSQNPKLTVLMCNSSLGPLTCLNLKNGNNTNMTTFVANNNPYLFCIEVDDPSWSIVNWTTSTWPLLFSFNQFNTFSTNCNYPAGCF